MGSETRKHVLIGLIGDNISASLTPAMHEREGAEQGLHYFYQRIDLAELGLGVDALPELLLAARRIGFAGLNITHPCKQAVVELLDDLSDQARAIGAVNTVRIADGRMTGHNTDGMAFVKSFQNELAHLPHETIVLLGAGGAGTAIAHSMLNSVDTKIVIYDIERQHAAQLVGHLQALYGEGRALVADSLEEALATADGVINATPQGMKQYPGSAVPPALLRTSLWVADIVYFPLETQLLKEARAAGCTVMRGSGMAVGQAVGAFEIFTGIKPDAVRMQKHFQEMIGGKQAAAKRSPAKRVDREMEHS